MASIEEIVRQRLDVISGVSNPAHWALDSAEQRKKLYPHSEYARTTAVMTARPIFERVITEILDKQLEGEDCPTNYRFLPSNFSLGTIIRYDVERLIRGGKEDENGRLVNEADFSRSKRPASSLDGPIRTPRLIDEKFKSGGDEMRTQYSWNNWFAIVLPKVTGEPGLFTFPYVRSGDAVGEVRKPKVQGLTLPAHENGGIGRTSQYIDKGGREHREYIHAIEVFGLAVEEWQAAYQAKIGTFVGRAINLLEPR